MGDCGDLSGRGVAAAGLLVFAALAGAAPAPAGDAGVVAAGASPPRAYRWVALPRVVPSPPENPANPAKLALGRRLFNDPRLSRDGTVSCASCHDVARGAGDDARPTAVGVGRQRGARNTPTVWNAGFLSVLFWDGRAASLEAQAQAPILNPVEMGLPSGHEAVRRVSAVAAYRTAFRDAFGDGRISFARIAQAIAAYERSLVTADAPYDRFVRGDAGALDAAQLRGMALFESIGCVRCHAGPMFSDASALTGGNPLRIFPANHASMAAPLGLLADRGANRATAGPGVWRVPSLRNVALTAPYFHNGAVADLHQAVRLMAATQLDVALAGEAPRAHYWLSATQVLRRRGRAQLSARDVDDIVAFLHALSGEALCARVRAREPGPASVAIDTETGPAGAHRCGVVTPATQRTIGDQEP